MRKRKVSLNRLIPGMVTAEPVYTEDNQMIIPKNYVLTPKVIKRLQFYLIKNISVVISDKQDEIVLEKNPNELYLEKVRKSEDFKVFFSSYKASLSDVENSLNQVISKNKEMDAERMLDSIDQVLITCNNSYHILDLLQCIKDYDDHTFVHSLNVALICNIFGNWLKLSADDIRVLTMAGLLHDIGKLVMPSDIIKKPGKLTKEEYEIIQQHPLSGYNLLEARELDERIKMAALMHHERCDGKGYPGNLSIGNISEFAKIVCIVDVYEAMTSNRVYRNALCPFYVIEIFEEDGYKKYDPAYLLVFLERIAESYIHSTVRLSDNSLGEVVMVNANALSKPVVRVGEKFYDLSINQELAIESLI